MGAAVGARSPRLGLVAVLGAALAFALLVAAILRGDATAPGASAPANPDAVAALLFDRYAVVLAAVAALACVALLAIRARSLVSEPDGDEP